MSALLGLEVLDDHLLRHPGVYDYDPLRLAIDVRGTGASGYEIAELLREQSDIGLELCGDTLVVAVFGMGEPIRESCDRLVEGLRDATTELANQAAVSFAPGAQLCRLAGGRWP